MRVLIVEDVITTGKSTAECEKIVKEFEGNVVGYACLIDRTSSKSKLGSEIVSQIKIEIPTYEPDKLPDDLLKIKAVKPGRQRSLMSNKRLGVNIDHVATVRNARGELYPSPLKAAQLAKKSGADSITIHLREDRRHIVDRDLIEIKKILIYHLI